MSPAAAVEANLVDFFRHFARVRRTGRIEEKDGVSIASSGIEFHMFNAAFFAEPAIQDGEDLGKRIEAAASGLGTDGGRWAFWACTDRFMPLLEVQVAKSFRKWGLFPAFRHPGMACEQLPASRRALPDLEFRAVEDAAGRIDFARLNSLAFHIPFEWCLDLYDIEALWGGGFAGSIGYRDGQAVCCAARLVASGAVGVYSVATLPGHERKGYGEAVTRHAVEEGQRESGLRRSILQATKAGLPLYRRMGYELVTNFVVYSS